MSRNQQQLGTNHRLRHHHEETLEVLEHMRRLECTVYKRPVDLVEPFNGLWRQQIVEWMYTIAKFCDLRHEAASAATFYLDVSVSKGLITSPEDYQLGALTAFYLALKVFDSPSTRTAKLSSLVKLGNGHFDEADVLEMECDMLHVLQWKVNPPTPNCFLHQYLTLFPDKDSGTISNPEALQALETRSLHYIEKCLARDASFGSIPPSVLAYASMLMALNDMNTLESIGLNPLSQFLQNMCQVAQLDFTSAPLNHATLLMERTFRKIKKGHKTNTNDVDEEEDSASSTTTSTTSTLSAESKEDGESDDWNNRDKSYDLKHEYAGTSPSCVGSMP